jgi:bzd-type benzoyl-CoA reductase Q subunit
MIETKTDYWRWAESNWRNENIDWRKANILSAGVDVGSVSSQAVVMADGKLLAYSNMRTGSNSPDSARNAMSWAIEGTDLKVEDIHFIVGTGYGRVNVPFAHKTITEIHCHARGGNFMYGDKVRTVMDMGGQDCKAIRCDGRGKVVAFQMNDKCAAGTGRGMEVFADLLQIPIDRVGPMSLSVAEEPPPVSSTCVVFAKSEAAGLLRQGWDKEKVLAAYCSAMAHRVFNLLERVGVGFESLKSDIDSQIAGAVGAALFGLALETKKRAKGTG